MGLLLTLRFSFKYGAIDWLVRERRSGQLVGVLHLFELSLESYRDGPPPCVVGYAIGPPHRRRGYGTEALTHLLTQAAALFGRTEARAIVETTNAASEGLLRKTGFVVLEERATERLWQRQLIRGK